ncbi:MULTISPECIES: Arc family DNA-binding protein [unclassified Xanthomonas]|uniref:Arc family DNA-binding protein n=1 Tax=unclassified Xanthomonas TaxID=2643310 RepID=UPI002A811F73|nr:MULTISPECIES: Arc family DNA-binding protein [unclassified Xanthomonas]MDY4297542.1 Arc family DNA-binding protein [Xanthomonas sp. LF02-5]MDY4359336.1 Arc family DNA-binding protein [Xanthomonas sp. LF04-12]
MTKKTETRPSTAAINPFGLRMQPELRERLEAAANEAGRSLNAEIAERLELSFSRKDFPWLLESRINEYEALMQKRDEILNEMNKMQAFAHELASSDLAEDARHVQLLQERLARLHEERALLAKLADTVSESFNIVLKLGADHGAIRNYRADADMEKSKPKRKR